MHKEQRLIFQHLSEKPNAAQPTVSAVAENFDAQGVDQKEVKIKKTARQLDELKGKIQDGQKAEAAINEQGDETTADNSQQENQEQPVSGKEDLSTLSTEEEIDPMSNTMQTKLTKGFNMVGEYSGKALALLAPTLKQIASLAPSFKKIPGAGDFFSKMLTGLNSVAAVLQGFNNQHLFTPTKLHALFTEKLKENGVEIVKQAFSDRSAQQELLEKYDKLSKPNKQTLEEFINSHIVEYVTSMQNEDGDKTTLTHIVKGAKPFSS
jgi:arsenate reductase-like glutaredoxin family protein